ncbi:MAG: DUF4126 domain-containing protein [Xanthomonadales bacterium]|nr:DUF4126 domain-containing protein [Xanthomonadales bacterium]
MGIAALMESGAYFVPLVDNMLDVLTTPAALAGGTVIVSSLLPEMNPVAQWTTAALLGGGTAGIVQTGTVLTRGASTITSAGLANPLVATGETGGSLLAVALAIFVPVFFGVAVVIGLVALLVWIVRRLSSPRQSAVGNDPMQPPH